LYAHREGAKEAAPGERLVEDMNISEGTRRIAVALRFVGVFLAAVVGWSFYKAGGDESVPWLVGGAFLIGFWGLAWIIDGYAKPKT
jgi:hypothetical protein